MTIFAELKRRNVFRVGIAYLVASWVLMQVVDVISPVFELPEWAPKLIFLLLAIGLVPALIFAWAFELTPEGIKKESEVSPEGSITRSTGRKLNIVIIGFLVAAVALLLVERQLKTVDTPEPDTAVATEAGAGAGAGTKSIAVLPFVNMSSDAEQEFFSDGITEEILNSLASVRELKVAGRTSSFAFKGQNDDLRRIGDALGVEHILEGSVRKAGAKVRITAQLIQVEDGFHLWSETYDRELTDVFAIQDEIANEILRQLKSQLLNQDVVVAEAQRTSPEVYELYLKAKQRIYTRIGTEIQTAVNELDEAIRLDPEYAPALAQRGIATMLLSDQQYGSIPHDEAHRRGKRFIDHSLALDSNLAEGWAGLGLYSDQDSDAAIDALEKALAINPNLIDASNWLQIALRDVGDMRGSLAILEEIAERDPLYRPAFSNAMIMFNNFGRQDKAEALLERIEAFDPDNPDLLLARATNYVFSGRFGEGLQLMEQRREMGEMSGMAKMFISGGLMSTGQYERAAIEGIPYAQPVALYEIGRIDDAFERSYEQARAGYPGNLFYLLIREDRYQDLVDYLEERWPSLAAFASEIPADDYGYPEMSSVALAYLRTGNQERFDEAVRFIENRINRLAEEGIKNFVFSANRGIHFAMLGDVDAAFTHLKAAVEGGWRIIGDPVTAVPELAGLADDPRFDELKAAMLANANADRELLGLPLFDENFQVLL